MVTVVAEYRYRVHRLFRVAGVNQVCMCVGCSFTFWSWANQRRKCGFWFNAFWRLFYPRLISLDLYLASPPSCFYLYHCWALCSSQGYYHLLPLASLTVLPKPPPIPWGLWLENKAAVTQKAKRIYRKTGLNEFMLSQSGEERNWGVGGWGNNANMISALLTSPWLQHKYSTLGLTSITRQQFF